MGNMYGLDLVAHGKNVNFTTQCVPYQDGSAQGWKNVYFLQSGPIFPQFITYFHKKKKKKG